MKWPRQQRVHLNEINSVSIAKLNHEYSCKSKTSKPISDANDFSFERSIDWHALLKIDRPSQLSLAQMVAAPARISSQLKRLEKNYQVEYLGFEREAIPKAIVLKISVVEDRDDRRQRIYSMLRKKFQVVEAKDSSTAIENWRERRSAN